jgi:integrase
VAFLTAYQSDRQLRQRISAALATLTTQGRAVGVGVLAALQDPRKEVMNIRNLFPDKIALRLDESEQVDMVLHFHDLRHTGNTLAAQSGASLADLKARMGHDSDRAALIYQHATKDADQRIADALSARVEAERKDRRPDG